MKKFVSAVGVASLLGAGALAGCGGKQKTPDPDIPENTPSLVNIQPREGVFLRAGFDADPSDYLGRFINDAVEEEDIDETEAVQTQCTEHLETKEVRAGGTFDEYYELSTGASASLGVKPTAFEGELAPSGNASAGLQKGTVVRVKYDLTKKMRAVKTDEYYECCRKHVGACSGRMLGEFWAGTGEIYQAMGTEKGVKASANIPTKGDASVEFKQGIAWKKAQTFEKMYFAFRPQRTKINTNCAWADNPPVSDEGQYFVGISGPVATEQQARDRAMRNARVQAVKYLGEVIATASKTKSSAMEGYLEDEEIVQTAAKNIAKRVKDDRWCPAETKESPEGVLYKSKVLAFFPQKDRAEAAIATLDAVEAKLEASGEMSEEQREQLKQLRQGLKEGGSQ